MNGNSGNSTTAVMPREAGFGQTLILMIATMLPVFAMVSLAPDVPRLFEHFLEELHFDTLVPLIMTAPALVSPFAGILVNYVGHRRILPGAHKPSDFIIADAKDADMAFGLTVRGPFERSDVC